MSELQEHHICPKFSFKLDKTLPETQQVLKTSFGDSAKSGYSEDSVENYEHSGWCSTGGT
jgi:hypothetical protein